MMRYMAVPKEVYDGLLSEAFGRLIVDRFQLKVLVFDEEKRKVLRWIR